MEQDLVSQLVTQFDVFALLKPFTLVLVGLYLVFSLVIVRQVGLMTTFLGTGTTPLIRLVSWIHFLLAAAIFVIVLVFV